MNQPLGLLGTPGVGFFFLIFIGILAGWIAEKVTKSDHGLLTNMIIGIAGSFVGTSLAGLAGIVVGGTIGHIIAAAVGSIVLIYGWRALNGNRVA